MAKWRQERSVTSSGQFVLDNGEIDETDEFIWRMYSLFLLINRHVAECVDDDTVSNALRHMRTKVPIPFETI